MITRKVSTLALALLACAPLAASAAGSAFEMASYTNWPGGDEIAARDYAAAAASASRARSHFDSTGALVAKTNECVARTVSGDLGNARAACDAAVRLAAAVDRTSYPRLAPKAATARALSNRGVLRAMTGDSVGAAGDFRAAAQLAPSWATATANLTHLEALPAHRLALAGANADGR
jgi:hypothetical protein